MKINIFVPESLEPHIFEVSDVRTVSQAVQNLDNADLRARLVDESGLRRYVSAYLGVPGCCRQVRLTFLHDTGVKELTPGGETESASRITRR